jgi:ferritin-like metal-binding protein YciE
MNGKPISSSRTIIVAILMGLAASANYLTEVVTDPKILNGAVVGAALIMAILRAITTEPLK